MAPALGCVPIGGGRNYHAKSRFSRPRIMYTLSLNDKEFLALAELIEQALQNMLPKWQEEDIKELRGGQLIATCVERSSPENFQEVRQILRSYSPYAEFSYSDAEENLAYVYDLASLYNSVLTNSEKIV